jgi:segregation and condensation protein B
MSLKAKIEAVIYAAEEPVTLAQLAALFADELPPPPSATPASTAHPEVPPTAESLIERGFLDVAGFGQSSDLVELTLLAQRHQHQDPKPATSEAHPLSPPERESGAPILDESSTVDKSGNHESTPPLSQTLDAQAQAKRAARQRDREVREQLKAIVDALIADYATSDRGMEIREVANGYRIATKPEYHDAVRAFVKSLKPPMKLSLQALETLAVIAYKQPITAPEVSEIRGVDSSGVLGGLIARKLITTAGRKQVIGRPILYKTTREFLLRFGLKDLNELPSIEEFEKLASDIELSEEETPAEPTTLPFEAAEAELSEDATEESAPSLETAPPSPRVGLTNAPAEGSTEPQVPMEPNHG